MKKQILVSLILAGSLVSSLARAEEQKEQSQAANSSSVKMTDVQKKDETVKEDIDNEITNAKLRAEMGSKSRWSIKTAINYNGGTVEKPFAGDRPNIAASTNTDVQTSLSGTVAVAYRLSARDSLSFGTGVAIATPFQTTQEDLKNS
ncbi:MAG TPA: hypothetical protein VN132_15915, partial [Bdellovibrio sp.]|nr:hypothetical protein [Bdellovibrio sp.]